MGKKLSFSYSKMGMYQECPQKYKFRYIHMIPEQPKYYFAFGTALHSVMEFIYNPENTLFPSLSEALTYFDSVWDKTTYAQKGYASVEKELEGYAEGRRIIESYYQAFSGKFIHPLSTELKSTLDIDGLSLISIVDRMDYLGDGLVKILDYKTGKTVQREPDQLYMYQKVVENSPLIKTLVQQKDPSVKEVRVGQLSFYHLPTLHEMTFERAPDKEIFAFWQKVLTVADNIRAGNFAPNPGEKQCRWCDYRNLCPVFTGKEYKGDTNLFSDMPAKTTSKKSDKKEEELPLSDQDFLTEKIDRYGDLLQELEELKREVIRLMKKNNFSRHFGQHYKAELSIAEKTTFEDKEKVMALLREQDLLGKVLVPTQSKIVALLADKTISAQTREKLQKLAHKIEQEVLQVQEIKE